MKVSLGAVEARGVMGDPLCTMDAGCLYAIITTLVLTATARRRNWSDRGVVQKRDACLVWGIW